MIAGRIIDRRPCIMKDVKLHCHKRVQIRGLVFFRVYGWEAKRAASAYCCVECRPVWRHKEGEPVCIECFALRVDGECESCGEVCEFSRGVVAEEEGLSVGGSADAIVF
ncbi:hypothetical protein GBA52_013784 [Prunus armeniaca]|nr:hypothetical protein GBA52_013784 [Prunus armeniaca]